MGDEEGIPKFLKLTEEQRKKAREDHAKKERPNVVAPTSDPRKPGSMTDKEWEERKAERKREEEKRAKELEEARKAKRPKKEPVDTEGKRWNPRKGRWEVDPHAHLSGTPTAIPSQPTKPKKPVPKGKGKGKATGPGDFGLQAGTNREKLAKAMVKRIGEMVTLTEWSKVIYGKANDAAAVNVIMGLAHVLKKNKEPYEIIKDKNDKGQVVFGFFEIE